ncbi:unnamed protein product [Phytophthora fragariaefolia]|uniref:Unnamed protein product n=1 Tax=Phytophthora fragariaefolia TaxID=1490495 RepID=A0A9W7CXR5_9STRA|nr:unnamed protein product [Phytophthora fragariaefolia]
MAADSINSKLTSQFPFKSPSTEDQATMQYGLFMVLVAACIFGSCDLVVGSVDKEAMTDEITWTNDRMGYGNDGRLLRASGVGEYENNEKLEGEGRANAFLDWFKSLLVKAKKPAPDLKRTFPSPPVADKLERSEPSILKGCAVGENVEAI